MKIDFCVKYLSYKCFDRLENFENISPKTFVTVITRIIIRFCWSHKLLAYYYGPQDFIVTLYHCVLQ